MPVLRLETFIQAPVERCFDLSCSLDLHQSSLAHTRERAVAGVTTGLIGMGEEVTWEARHFGLRQRLTVRITTFERPRHFRDSMVRGAFARFDHDHFFTPQGGGTLMRDVFDYTSPLGPLGWLADRLFLAAYMRRLLEQRNAFLKQTAESGAWQALLGP